MFWIGFIVGIVSLLVLALLGWLYIRYCMKKIDVSWEDFDNLVELNKAVVINRDCRVKVYDEDTDTEVFETYFTYPWEDEDYE